VTKTLRAHAYSRKEVWILKKSEEIVGIALIRNLDSELESLQFDKTLQLKPLTHLSAKKVEKMKALLNTSYVADACMHIDFPFSSV